MPLQVTSKVSEADKHVYDVNSVIVHQGSVYSGADDGKIIRWDESLTKLGEVEAHPCSIYSLCAIKDSIYSCSNDGTVKSWTLDLQPKSTLIADECEYWKLATSNGILYAGDDKGMLRSFENDESKSMFELLEIVKDMRVVDDVVYMSRDTDVILFKIGTVDKNTYASNRIIFPGRAPLTLVGDKLAFCDRSAKGIVVHENSNEMNYRKLAEFEKAHEMIILAIDGQKKNDDIFIYTGGWDKIIKEWKLTRDKLEKSDECIVDIVLNSLCATENGVIYGGGNNGCVVKIQT